MTTEQLRMKNMAVIRKWSRTISDHDGAAPPGLLDELSAIAREYAAVAVHVAAAQPAAARRPRKPIIT